MRALCVGVHAFNVCVRDVKSVGYLYHVMCGRGLRWGLRKV